MKNILFTVVFLMIALPVISQKKNIITSEIEVSGACSMCKNRIENALKIKGINTASWDIESNQLSVKYDTNKISLTAIEQKLAEKGHDTKNFQATDKVYSELPDCCLYERKFKPQYHHENPDVATVAVHDNEESQAEAIADHLEGFIFSQDENGNILPLSNTTVYSKSAKKSAISDALGKFVLHGHTGGEVIISHVGYKTETVDLKPASEVEITLKKNTVSHLQEVVVTAKKFSSFINTKSATNTLNIGIKELKKAACCNLSESFETTPSVDVSYSDAITGMRQIQMLGLSGPYSLITTENTPEIRGLSSIYGLTFIPGPWISDIQLTKGAGSVVNGYESIAGQINVELIKPEKAPKLYVNGYANDQGRLETSVNFSKRINDKWSTALLTHLNGVVGSNDHNKDNYLDVPKGNQWNVINRWQYGNEKGFFSQFAIKALNDERQSGQLNYNPAKDKFTTNAYGVGINASQYGISGKVGYVFPDKNFKSFGFIFNANKYKNDSYYGLNSYKGEQNSLYGNFIYQSIIGNEKHKFKAGAGIQADNIKETVNLSNYLRKETVPGLFGEYTFSPNPKFTLITGARVDFHNAYGTMFTPRVHLKYDADANTNIRVSAGSGFRTANIFAENTGLFVTGRRWNFVGNNEGFAYGFQPEKAWNLGLNFVRKFRLNERQGFVSLDAYRTTFKNQVVVDVDRSPQEIFLFNLNGKSYSNSLQAELNYEVINNFDVRFAYRWLDVKTQYLNGLLEKPLVAKSRAFVNLAYETNNSWKFDLTTQLIGKKRLPDTKSNPVEYRMEAYSPKYFQVGTQVTKVIGEKWDVYLGMENLTNFSQKHMFISGDQPFSPYFDGSMVWAPANGRMLYAGFRFTLK